MSLLQNISKIPKTVRHIRPKNEICCKDRRERYREAADLLLQWINEDGGCDEHVWPEIKRELTKTSVRYAG